MLSSAMSVAATATNSAMNGFSRDSPACSTAPLTTSSRSPTGLARAVRHPEVRRRVAQEVHFDQDGLLVAHDPAVVAGPDRDDLRRDELLHGAVGVLDVHAPPGDEPDVRVHAQLRSDRPLHVRGPAETRLVDHALDAARAGPHDVHLDAVEHAGLGA